MFVFVFGVVVYCLGGVAGGGCWLRGLTGGRTYNIIYSHLVPRGRGREREGEEGIWENRRGRGRSELGRCGKVGVGIWGFCEGGRDLGLGYSNYWIFAVILFWNFNTNEMINFCFNYLGNFYFNNNNKLNSILFIKLNQDYLDLSNIFSKKVILFSESLFWQSKNNQMKKIR